MANPNDSITGALKLLGDLNNTCFNSLQDFALWIEANYGVEIPANELTVVVGNVEPINPQITALWIREDNSGTFVGVYIYSSGQWIQILPVQVQLFRIVGSSLSVPTGFTLANTSSQLSAAEQTFIQGQWYLNPSNPAEYLIFDVVFGT